LQAFFVFLFRYLSYKDIGKTIGYGFPLPFKLPVHKKAVSRRFGAWDFVRGFL